MANPTDVLVSDSVMREQANTGAPVGGAGNDNISGNGFIDGGTGNDTINGTGTLIGGEGNDFINAFSASTVDAGIGIDKVTVRAQPYSLTSITTVDLGSDADIDTVVLSANLFLMPPFPGQPAIVSAATVIVSNFVAGAGGDVLNIAAMLGGFDPMSTIQGWDGSTNPFFVGVGGGYFRLLQDGADTVFEIDQTEAVHTDVRQAQALFGQSRQPNARNVAPEGSLQASACGVTIKLVR